MANRDRLGWIPANSGAGPPARSRRFHEDLCARPRGAAGACGLDLTAPAPKGLGHDYRVDVAVVVWEWKDVLRLPSTALFRAGERWGVFVVCDGRARRTLVEVGPSDGTWIVAVAGAQEGEAVITQTDCSVTPCSAASAAGRRYHSSRPCAWFGCLGGLESE